MKDEQTDNLENSKSGYGMKKTFFEFTHLGPNSIQRNVFNEISKN